MPAQQRWLPLFPLNTVLFPGGALPIHIFEDRYKLMMQRCLESDKKLGIVLIKSGSEVGQPAIPYSTGTMGQVVQASGLDDGRMFVSVAGEQRFRIRQITQSQPYIGANVDLLEEDPDAWVPPTEMNAIRQAVSSHIVLADGPQGRMAERGQARVAPRVALILHSRDTLRRRQGEAGVAGGVIALEASGAGAGPAEARD